MKNKTVMLLAAFSAAFLMEARGSSIITAWTFDNVAVGAISNPPPATGAGLANAIGMTTALTTPPSISNPDVQSLAGSSSGGANCWRVRAKGASPNNGNGWTSLSPIGSQGAEFDSSTLGYGDIQVSFDVNETAQGEANLQLQYTTDGSNWFNATITSAGASATLQTNTSSANTVMGTYVKLSGAGTGWNNLITADLSAVPGVNNNPSFGIRIVNASTGADCVNSTGAPLNNTSGNWSIDNVVISGVANSTITAWTFDNLPVAINNSPAPSTGSGTATPLGMDNSYNGTTAQTTCDVLADVAGNSTGSGLQDWRVRGQNPGNGWSTEAPIGTQGAEFALSTVGYNGIKLTFDISTTKQAEANLEVIYTTDGINWSNAPLSYNGSNAAVILTNTLSANTVMGTYIQMQNPSGGWYTNITADLSGISATTNNQNFAVAIVNASMGSDCINQSGATYNNSSGNWRLDNIVLSGLSIGAGGNNPAPSLTPDPNASVDFPFTNTFTPTPAWQFNITNVMVNGATLPTAAYNTNVSGQLIFTPSASPLLQTNPTLNIVIGATGFGSDSVVQHIAAGAPISWGITAQPVAPTGNGGTLVIQPTITFQDQYGNAVTNIGGTVTASPVGAWSFGPGSGATIASGAFTNLSATSASVVSGATISFATTIAGLSPLTSAPFDIPAPTTAGFTRGNLAVFQEDVASKNSTFSIIELNSSAANQSAPVNIFPISATGTNALRQSSAGTTGRLANNNDGSLVCFTGFETESSLIPDVTSVDPRGVGTLNAAGAFVLQTSYIGLGESTANQTRSATSIDNTNWFIGDKGGVYINNGTSPLIAGAGNNVRSVKSFGGTVYALQQASSSVINTPISIITNAVLLPLDGLAQDDSVLDFYMVQSGANGTNYDTVYYIDGTNGTAGAIFKYYLTQNIDSGTGQQLWALAGSATTTNGGDGLCAMTNASGGVDLYYTSGSGGDAGNSLVKVHDSAPDNTTINLGTPEILYTAPVLATLKGVAFAPASTNSSVTPPVITPLLITPGSVLITGSGASATAQFSFTNATGLTFNVLATNNLTAPITTWPVIGTAVENPPGSGQYQFSDPTPATNSTRYYLLRH